MPEEKTSAEHETTAQETIPPEAELIKDLDATQVGALGNVHSEEEDDAPERLNVPPFPV